jgi:hypothetical protein
MWTPTWMTTIALVFNGWWPGRDVWGRLKLPPSFEAFPEAKRILARYGGLTFGPKTDYTRFDPSAGEEVADDIKEYQKQVGRRLYPVGYREHQDREYLLVDEAGIIYLLTDELRPMASSFERLLGYIVWKVERRRDIDEELRPHGLAGKAWRLEEVE